MKSHGLTVGDEGALTKEFQILSFTSTRQYDGKHGLSLMQLIVLYACVSVQVDGGASVAQFASSAEAQTLDLGDDRNGDMCSQVLKFMLQKGSLAQVQFSPTQPVTVLTLL